jgi:hypothetical protein
MPSHVCLSGRNKLIAGMLATAAVAIAAPAAQADTAAKSFQPVSQSARTATFQPGSLDSGSVDSAEALLKKAHRTVARGVSVTTVRHAIDSGTAVTVRKPAHSRAVELRIELGDDAPATTPTTTPTVTVTPSTAPTPTPSATTPTTTVTPATSPPATTTSPSTPADPQPSGACAVDPATMTGPGCNVLRSDTSEQSDPRAGLWGTIDCANSSRYQFENSGGDSALTAAGAPQDNNAFRELSVLDGDDYWGERCELGQNTSKYGVNRASQTNGTFSLYEQGDHKVTFFSERYPDNFSTSVNAWQTVAQMKQAQPYDNPTMAPILELQISRGKLILQSNWHEMWTTPAPVNNKWIRYAMDVKYSTDPDVGSVQVYADLNGDGDALDAGEQSPVMHMQTLLVETDGSKGTTDGYGPGDPIPDHLRLGIYHNPSIACPPPGGCSVDLDNVQVAG